MKSFLIHLTLIPIILVTLAGASSATAGSISATVTITDPILAPDDVPPTVLQINMTLIVPSPASSETPESTSETLVIKHHRIIYP